MKISATILSTLLGLSFLAAPPARGQAELHKDATLPAHPATLLALLPKPPPGWKVTKSGGQTRVLSWVITDVDRIIQKVEFAEGEDPNLPPVTEIRVRDTAYYPGYLGAFEDFVPNDASTPRRALIGSFPAFITQDSSAGLSVRLLAGRRFIVEMILQNQPETNVGLWLKAFDFQALSSIDKTPLAYRPAQADIVFIDELEPDNNNAYVTTLSHGNIAAQTSSGGLSEADRAELAAAEEDARQMAAEVAAAAAAEAAAPPAKEGEKNPGTPGN